MIKRILQTQIIESIKNKKSILLIGPRQTGKSTLIRSLHPSIEINLAHQPTFLEVARDPAFLEQVLRGTKSKAKLVFIDEVQRVPSILNTIQYLIDQKKDIQFILTGSSARKLRRGKANLLPGRIHSYELGPVISGELDFCASTEKLISFGSLPEVIRETDSRQIKRLLKTYAITYLNEEIKAEALTKNFEGFTRFLFLLAADSTKFLDLTKIAKCAAVPRQTVQRFFEILEDTLLVRRLDSYAKSDKRRLTQHPRFFIFDNGVLNSLLGNFNISEDRRGFLFENLFFNQLATSLGYCDLDYRLSSYRTEAGAEVDFILELEGEVYAIEVKSGYFKKSELSGFKSFSDFFGKPCHKYVVIPSGPVRMIDDITITPWQNFLKDLDLF